MLDGNRRDAELASNPKMLERLMDGLTRAALTPQ
jgi:hypothetical protein